MSARVKKSAAYSIPFLLLCALLIWAGPPKTSPAASQPTSRDEQAQTAATTESRTVELPPALLRTGGPYLDAESIRQAGLEEAIGHNADNPRAESVRFMTYGEAVNWYHSGWTPRVDFFREVYVVSVPGRVTVGHHVSLSYARSYYVFDATTGQLLQWGATDNPDPVTNGRPAR